MTPKPNHFGHQVSNDQSYRFETLVYEPHKYITYTHTHLANYFKLSGYWVPDLVNSQGPYDKFSSTI